MTTSRPTFAAVVQRSSLGALRPPVSKDDGESVQIAPLAEDNNVLFKEYRTGTCTPADDARLDRLIAVPRRLREADRALLARATCWPLSRVVDSGRTVGVLLPRAPAHFNFALKRVNGTGSPKPLAIDWLAKDIDRQAARGLPKVTFAQRLKVCRDIVGVAAIFEEEKIVYGDWSYANAFWSVSEFSGYVIDVDTCAFDKRPWVNTPNWEDPLTTQGGWVDSTTDRYRVALLVARCLSGERDPAAAIRTAQSSALAARMPGVGQILTTTVQARSRETRPTIAAILAELTQSTSTTSTISTANVVGWTPVGPKAASATSRSTAPPTWPGTPRPPASKTQPTTQRPPAAKPAAPKTAPAKPSANVTALSFAILGAGLVLLIVLLSLAFF